MSSLWRHGHLGHRSGRLAQRPLHAPGGLGALRRRLRQPGRDVRPRLPRHLADRGGLLPEAGAAVSSYGLGALGASLLGGTSPTASGDGTRSPSRCSRRPRRCWSSPRRALPVVLLLSALAGLTSELYRPAAGALLADLIPPERRLTGYALYRLAINLGFAAGPAAAGLLAERSFFLLFVGEAVSSAIFGLAALFFLPQGTRSTRAEEQPSELMRAIRGDRPFLLFLVASLLSAFVYFQQQGALLRTWSTRDSPSPRSAPSSR